MRIANDFVTLSVSKGKCTANIAYMRRSFDKLRMTFGVRALASNDADCERLRHPERVEGQVHANIAYMRRSFDKLRMTKWLVGVRALAGGDADGESGNFVGD